MLDGLAMNLMMLKTYRYLFLFELLIKETNNINFNVHLKKVVERPALSEILKCIPSTGLSRYNNSPNILKTAESVTCLQPATQYASPSITSNNSLSKPNNDLLQFIEKQEGYIEQLERESHFCRASYCVLLIFFHKFIK